MAEWLKPYPNLTEDPSSVPSTQVGCFTTAFNVYSREYDAPCWPLQTLHSGAHIHRHIYILLKKMYLRSDFFLASC